jgi:hypothetical protein
MLVSPQPAGQRPPSPGGAAPERGCRVGRCRGQAEQGQPSSGGPAPLPSWPTATVKVTPQASAPPATVTSSRRRRGSGNPSALAASWWRPRAASWAATTDPTAAAPASSPRTRGPRRESWAAVYASTAWPPATTARMAASDHGPSTGGQPDRSRPGSVSDGRHPVLSSARRLGNLSVAGCAVAPLWAAADRWPTACRSASSAWPRRRSTSRTWLATAVTLGSSRRAWKTRRARSCDPTKRWTGRGLPRSQDRPASTAALAIARSARGLVGLLRDSTSR